MKRRGYLTTPLLSPALLAGSRLLLAGLLCVLSAHANAWMAIAHGDDGFAFVERNAGSSERAAAKALEECGRESNGCHLVGEPVVGPVALVVVRGDGGIGVSTNRDPLAAAADAMKYCNAHFSGSCRPDAVSWDEGDRWYAISEGNGGAFVAYGYDSDTGARLAALQGCRKRGNKPETCEVEAPNNIRTWIAVAENATSLAWARGSTKDAALALARSACAKESEGKPCAGTSVVFNPGPVAAPSSVAVMQKRIEQRHKTASVPGGTGTVAAYADTCNNADCIRKYGNGKAVRYTACLNPATSLPMNDPARLGGCGGTDSRGNIYGTGSL